jgi:hypothetical protein
MSDNSKSDKTTHSPKPPPPVGPTDHGGKGGMATREVAPEIAEPDATEPPD